MMVGLERVKIDMTLLIDLMIFGVVTFNTNYRPTDNKRQKNFGMIFSRDSGDTINKNKQ